MIRVISLRKTSKSEFDRIEDEFLKRLSKYHKVKLVDLKRGKIKSGSEAADLQQLRENLKPGEYVVAMSEEGRQFTSRDFSSLIEKRLVDCRQGIAFVIGGPEGLPGEIIASADMVMSLSKMTFPHKIARMLLIEALYRSFDILRGGKYHKD